jgi:hypothetical protein
MTETSLHFWLARYFAALGADTRAARGRFGCIVMHPGRKGEVGHVDLS